MALSKSFSPSSQGAPYVVDERVFSNFFTGAPISVVLVDSFTTGFLIKTYFQKYKIIYGFNQPEVIVVRTSQNFWKKNLKNIGMSLFRRTERDKKEGIIPLPAGSLYIGDLAYGNWKNTNSGSKIWKFHRAYRHFPAIFGWGNDFKPSKSFYEQLNLHIQEQEPFYGENNEFGKDGSITMKGFAQYKREEENTTFTFKKILEKYLYLPKWSSEEEAEDISKESEKENEEPHE